jgi:cell division protein ZapA (FtsZ GTPase activity inhibitor)
MSKEQEVFHINVIICDRPYRLKIQPSEEESVRKAAKQISDKVKELQTQFAGKDKQDYLAMYALTLAVGASHSEHQLQHMQEDVVDELSTIDTLLRKALEQ